MTVADDTWAERIASGAAVVTAAAPYAAYAEVADAVVVGGSLETDLSLTSVRSVDPARPLSSVDSDPVSGPAYDVGAVAVAAYLVGLGRAMVEQAVAYAGTREQFGRADRVVPSSEAPARRRAPRG